MKHPMGIICTLLGLCGCVATVPEETPQEKVQKLVETRNPVEIIKAFKETRDMCKCAYGLSYSSCRTDDYNNKMCAYQQELSVSDTNFRCLYDKTHQDYYNSDECILYRRNTPTENRRSVNDFTYLEYFDYRRLFGEDSAVKTDADFWKMVDLYDELQLCDKDIKQVLNNDYYPKFVDAKDENDNPIQQTTVEKQQCKDDVVARMVARTKSKQHCKETFKQKYDEFLQEQAKWFNWAINHDPNARVREWRQMAAMFGAPAMAQFAWTAYDEVRTPAEAEKEVKESVDKFSHENWCSTDGWKSDIKKKGAKIK